jgi:sulfatase-modifying factor enzyme 1/uncharacterized protein DUF4062
MRVYLSSTLNDLRPEREAVKDALSSLQYIVVESYDADETSVLQHRLSDLAASDLYIGIVGLRCGFIPPGETKSITELEFDAASTHGIERLLFLKNPSAIAALHTDWYTKEHDPAVIDAFRKRLASGADGIRPAEFSTSEELKEMLLRALFRVHGSAAVEPIGGGPPAIPPDIATFLGPEARRILLPDISWVEIPVGEFVYQGKERITLSRFFMGRYPITNIQYQCFIDAGGYADERWWQDLEKTEPESPRWPQSNRPRTNVDWYEATAFCRWLSAQLGYEIRLPTEHEWERAAAGREGHAYPWGSDYRPGFANVDETARKDGPRYLQQSTAVGVYPQGRSAEGVLDLSGNVWEWCTNKHVQPGQTVADRSSDSRVLRGGSWVFGPDDARASDREGDLPGNRSDGVGFRVVSSAPMI